MINNELKNRIEDSFTSFSYGVLAVSSVTLWGTFYYTQICSIDALATMGPFAIPFSCPSPQVSMVVNCGLPAFAIGAGIKAKNAFENAWKGREVAEQDHKKFMKQAAHGSIRTIVKIQDFLPKN